jgi:sugar lactone lactonase YvrE
MNSPRAWGVAFVVVCAHIAGAAAAPPPAPPAAPESYMVAVATDGKGALFVGDAVARSIFRIADGKKTVVAKSDGTPRAPLYGLRSMAFDPAGSLVVADPASSEVYRVAPDGTLAPLGGGKLGQPNGVAVGPKGEVYVVDLTADALWRIAGGAAQKVAEMKSPVSVALDKDGSFLVLSRARGALLRVTADGKSANLVKDRTFAFPQTVLLEDAGTYLVSDSYAKTVSRVTRDGQVSIVAKSELLKSPQGLALEPGGAFLVADPHARTIFRVAPNGAVSAAYKE